MTTRKVAAAPAELFFTAAKVYEAAGDATASAAHLARAKALNPRVDQ